MIAIKCYLELVVIYDVTWSQYHNKLFEVMALWSPYFYWKQGTEIIITSLLLYLHLSMFCYFRNFQSILLFSTNCPQFLFPRLDNTEEQYKAKFGKLFVHSHILHKTPMFKNQYWLSNDTMM